HRGTDISRSENFIQASAGKTHYGAVYFRKGTEPYMTLTRPARDGGVTVAEVNLKLIWEVISTIRHGKGGLAYVIDAGRTLIAHPDISLVLKNSNMAALPQVAAVDANQDLILGRNLDEQEVFSVHAPIPTLNWSVFVEVPRSEVLETLYASILRTALLLVAGLLVSVVASFFLARTLVRPLRALQEGAAHIGAGDLDSRIEVKTGDELENLAEQFNQMSADLKSSYEGLERKVEERTSELTEALEQQTATSEILRVISSSPSDVQPVFEIIAKSAVQLCAAQFCAVLRFDGELLHLVAHHGLSGEGLEAYREVFPTPLSSGTVAVRLGLPSRFERSLACHCCAMDSFSVPSPSRAPRPGPSPLRRSLCSRLLPTRQ
ncbi:MAG: HAMP domain-containing protein, partial [Proteobacteria bacterium]|nr:HAMP domain-containing protein [Pseudomonadota bacterium]